MSMYAIATIPTPILNRPDFHSVFHPQGIELDNLGLLRSLEMIAFPKTPFTIVQKHPLFPHIYEVRTASYPVTYPIYVDGRCLEFCFTSPADPSHVMPSAERILSHMESLIGLPYVWGGNYSQGLPEMMMWYPPMQDKKLSFLEQANWQMKGVDCSGMLYEATLGLTPRNTSWLVFHGEGIFIKGLSDEEIAGKLKPLDMILWQGHVLFVLNQKHTIESRAQRGCVFVTPILERFRQIRVEEKKIPMNSSWDSNFRESGFIIRRGC